MNENNEAIVEALASLELENLKVSEEVIEEVLKSDGKLVREKGEQSNGKSRY